MEEEREDRPWQGFYSRAEDETRGLELEDREASGDHPPAFLAGMASGFLGINCLRY